MNVSEEKKFYIYIIHCSGPGCTAAFITSEPISKNATYTCREHTGKVEVKSPPAFQQFAHDAALGSAHDPIAYLKERDIDEKEN